MLLIPQEFDLPIANQELTKKIAEQVILLIDPWALPWLTL